MQEAIESCAICLEPIAEAERRSPPCGHRFHGRCLLVHTFSDDRCPCCRCETPPKFETFTVEELAFAMREITRIHRRTLRELKTAQTEVGIFREQSQPDSFGEFLAVFPGLLHHMR